MMSDPGVTHTTVRTLLGRQVHDPDGHRVGRIEEIQATEHGSALVVEYYLLGVYGAFARIASEPVWRWVMAYVGVDRRQTRRVPWDWMDLTDPNAPKLNRSRDDLRQLQDRFED